MEYRIRNLYLVFTFFALIFITFFIAKNESRQDVKILFSHESGFYEHAFELELSTDDEYDIYYTLDGTTPDRNSIFYDKPILVDDASLQDNIYSNRTDVCIFFDERAIEEYKDFPWFSNYRVPDYKVDKCNVIRVAIYDGDVRVAETQRVYWIGYNDRVYDNFIYVSLVTDPENLFGYENGIYVLGREFDEKGYAGWQTEGNFLLENKKKAYIDMFDEKGDNILSSNCEIKLKGGSGRIFSQKGFNMYSVGDSEYFDINLFGEQRKLQKIGITNSGNDCRVKIKDYLVSNLESEADSDFATLRMRPCIVFLDGEYWGVYFLSEVYDAEYFENQYGVSAGSVTFVKNGELAVGKIEDKNAYDEMVNFISNNDMTDEGNFARACELLDMESFVDYYATEIYIGNKDWYISSNNYGLWRSKEINANNKFNDGKWRYVLFDVNFYTTLGMPDENVIQMTADSYPIFASLIKNEHVQAMFLDRFDELENEIYTEDNLNDVIEWYNVVMYEPMMDNSSRFYDEGENRTLIDNTLNTIKGFLKNRKEQILIDWNSYFNILNEIE